MKRLFLWAVGWLIALVATAQSYYLPEGVSYDPDVPTPAEVFGFEPGERHVSPDQLVYYLRRLADASDRVHFIEYGRTFERRPLVLLTISDPANLADIENLRRRHLQVVDPAASEKLDLADMPVVVWMGYSVHGNEPSGANAAPLVAYHLAAAQDAATRQQLRQSVVLLDPVFNPDGLNRFAAWANAHRGGTPSADPADREHNEAWPRGRTNHYWFDLNRDWLPVQMPESRARVAQFYRWRPNVLTDHHEMGTNSTFFFQPGVPSRNNPLTPAATFDLTRQLAQYHARALDSLGSLYYSEESFDDFYPGKGSTFPDLVGAVGILFEQASARGHVQESANGQVTFPFAIRNQFVTSLSTLRGAVALRPALLAHQRDFYREAPRQDGPAAFVFGSATDPARAYHLAEVLRRHQIAVCRPAATVRAEGQTFEPATSYVASLDQPQARLLRALFARDTAFADSLFYDVSAWTLPLAFGVPYAPLARSPEAADCPDTLTFPTGALPDRPARYAYLLDWQEYYAPRTLYRLQAAGVRVKVATDTLRAAGKSLGRGTLVVPVSGQPLSVDSLWRVMRRAAREDGVDVYAATTGLNASGVDLGSPQILTAEQPKVALLVGKGVRSYDAGEVWHLLSERLAVPVTLLEKAAVDRTDLSRYNRIVMTDGNYGGVNAKKLEAWVRNGGVLVASQGAVRWLRQQGWLKAKMRQVQADTAAGGQYGRRSQDRGREVVGGAIVEARLDRTHPLGYGYATDQISTFRRGTLLFEPTLRYQQPLRFTEKPLLSGFISERNQAALRGAAAVTAQPYGRGVLVAFTDNPNFRAFWYGTNRLFLNAIFWGNLIDD